MRTCKAEGCSWSVFSHDYCRRHQYMRTDAKWLNKPCKSANKHRSIGRNTISPARQKTTSDTLKTQWGFETQAAMFRHIWATRAHVCVISGRSLEAVPSWQIHWTMAHIIPKGKYPMFKLNPFNIALLHPDVHTLVDNFTEDMQDKYDYDFDKWFAMQDEMKERYNQFLKDNML